MSRSVFDYIYIMYIYTYIYPPRHGIRSQDWVLSIRKNTKNKNLSYNAAVHWIVDHESLKDAALDDIWLEFEGCRGV